MFFPPASLASAKGGPDYDHDRYRNCAASHAWGCWLALAIYVAGAGLARRRRASTTSSRPGRHQGRQSSRICPPFGSSAGPGHEVPQGYDIGRHQRACQGASTSNQSSFGITGQNRIPFLTEPQGHLLVSVGKGAPSARKVIDLPPPPTRPYLHRGDGAEIKSSVAGPADLKGKVGRGPIAGPPLEDTIGDRGSRPPGTDIKPLKRLINGRHLGLPLGPGGN